VNVVIADGLIDDLNLSREQVLLDFAVGLYSESRVTLGRAARIAGVSSSEFMKELGCRRVPMHYDVGDLASDLESLRVSEPS
jgi:predicted HTH domain antitoxin